VRAHAPLKRFVDPYRSITYGIVQAGDDVPSGVPYIRPIDMAPWARDLDPSTLRRTAPEIAARYSRSAIAAGDLVISIGPSFGKLLIVPPALAGANLTQGTARVAPRDGVDARFLQWALASPLAKAHWEAEVGGATFRALNLGPLAETPIPLCSHDEQVAIADFLDRESSRIDRLLALRKRADDLITERERRLCDELTSTDAWTRLGWRASVQTGLTLGKDYGSDQTVQRPYLRVANVKDGWLDLSDVREVAVPSGEIKRCSLRDGDVLLTEGGDIDKLGRGTVWRNEIESCLHQNHVFAVRCGPELIPEFLALYTRTSAARAYFERTASRITNIASTNVTKVKALPVPELPIEEQRERLRQYEDWMRRMRAVVSLTARQRSHLVEYRESLIAEAMIGDLAVDQIPDSRLTAVA
jgi:type I restriction enzyme, S subunit